MARVEQRSEHPNRGFAIGAVAVLLTGLAALEGTAQLYDRNYIDRGDPPVIGTIGAGVSRLQHGRDDTIEVPGSGASADPEPTETAGSPQPSDQPSPTPTPSSTETPKSPEEKLLSCAHKVPLNIRAGQLMIVGIHGQKLDQGAKLLDDLSIGQLVVNSAPDNPRDDSLNRLKLAQKFRIVVSTDQEGEIHRYPTSKGFVSARKASQTMTPEQIEAMWFKEGKNLKSYGIDKDLAPVADLSGPNDVLGYGRTTGNDPAKAAEYVTAAVKGLQRADVSGVVKHAFSTEMTANTDQNPADAPSIAKQRKTVLPIYGTITGDTNIMVGHATPKGLGGPASQSREAITGELRERMGLKNTLIMSDDLLAGALRGTSGAQAAVNFVKAGGDNPMIIVQQPQPIEGTIKPVRDALAAAYKSKQLDRDQFDRSFIRTAQSKGLDVCDMARTLKDKQDNN